MLFREVCLAYSGPWVVALPVSPTSRGALANISNPLHPSFHVPEMRGTLILPDYGFKGDLMTSCAEGLWNIYKLNKF